MLRWKICVGAALVPATVLPVSMPAYGQIAGYPTNVESYDSREVAMLPRYCLYTQNFRDRVPGGNNEVEIKRHYALLGPAFHSLHHYCWGLMKFNRATVLARTPIDRANNLKSAIGEFDYVLSRAPQDFVLLPEILTKKGEVLLRLGQTAQGVQVLQRAIEIKPDYWPPYADLSDHFVKSGDLAKANELLDTALSFAPDSKSLKLRKNELEAARKEKRKAAPVAKE